MGRLLALILGGLALALYVPPFFLEKARPEVTAAASDDEKANSFDQVFIDTIGADAYDKTKRFGPGVFAGLALILFAVRGKE